MAYCVYMLTSPDGKKYIGVTCERPEKRWKRGKAYRKNTHLFRAIEKYGCLLTKTALPNHRGGRFHTMPLKRVRMRCERVLLWEYTYTTPPPNSIFFSVFK